MIDSKTETSSTPFKERSPARPKLYLESPAYISRAKIIQSNGNFDSMGMIKIRYAICTVLVLVNMYNTILKKILEIKYKLGASDWIVINSGIKVYEEKLGIVDIDIEPTSGTITLRDIGKSSTIYVHK